MGEPKDPFFTEDFPWVWERGKVNKELGPQDFVEDEDWIIYDFPGLTAAGYIGFLYAFERDQCSDFNLNQTFELFDLQRGKEDTYEHFLIVVQEDNYFKFDLKKISELMKGD